MLLLLQLYLSVSGYDFFQLDKEQRVNRGKQPHCIVSLHNLELSMSLGSNLVKTCLLGHLSIQSCKHVYSVIPRILSHHLEALSLVEVELTLNLPGGQREGIEQTEILGSWYVSLCHTLKVSKASVNEQKTDFVFVMVCQMSNHSSTK